jgi:hypothetical protein
LLNKITTLKGKHHFSMKRAIFDDEGAGEGCDEG